MPSYAFIYHDLYCPHCGVVCTDVISFQWGFCKYFGIPPREYAYTLGATIVWGNDMNGCIPRWVEFIQVITSKGTNMGDPMIKDLIVKGYMFEMHELHVCPGEGQHQLGGIALRIRDARIVDVWIYEPGEYTERTDYFLGD